MHTIRLLTISLASCAALIAESTRVGIIGSQFTINGKVTYTAESGFPNAYSRLAGTLLNVRAVQAVFEDAQYPGKGSRNAPYTTNVMGPVWFDYPDAPYDPERNLQEFLSALPDWRACGLLAFTINLQGGGPVDGNYGENAPMQPHRNTAFRADGSLRPEYMTRVRRVLETADKLGMVVIVGLFYQGMSARVDELPGDAGIKRGIVEAVAWLKAQPFRNVLLEIQNEVGVRVYKHRMLTPAAAAEALVLARREAAGEFPVSVSWAGSVRDEKALKTGDYLLFHTNGRTPEQVHEEIASMRRLGGYDKPLMINEDGVSTFNLQAAVEEGVGWGFYDQGTNNYVDGFQSPPVNWRISSPVKWLFFEQVARLTGSPAPARPNYNNPEAPRVRIFGLDNGQTVSEPLWVEAIAEDRHPRWPIKRVEFYVDGKPYSYRNRAPYLMGNVEFWDPRQLAPGEHTLRVVAFDMRGPRFSETASIEELRFRVASRQGP
ncbi:MAG: Ig-like domain-containing protein [Bryobacteraceae bacterium]|nr:Ig-like domain-containing protein [Bryobacteraceae bacterium]